MDQREEFEAQREAKRETLGPVDRSTRDRIWGGLIKYLAAEARHAGKSSSAKKAAEQENQVHRSR